jgi:hypothetical protein
LDVVSFGLRFVGMKDFGGQVRGAQSEVFKEVNRLAHTHGVAPPGLVRRCFDAAGWAGHMIVPVDCRMFFDPAGHTGHVGLHSRVVEGVVRHPEFAAWMAGVVRGIDSHVQEAASQGTPARGLRVVVAFYCKSGRHRSVAAASLVAGCIATSDFERLGLVFGDTTHLARGFWGGRMCNGCAECHEIDRRKRMAQDTARRLWRASWESLLGAAP